ncbi:MAG: L-dopachrome tautomerase-related protein [Opitutales bacterium]
MTKLTELPSRTTMLRSWMPRALVAVFLFCLTSALAAQPRTGRTTADRLREDPPEAVKPPPEPQFDDPDFDADQRPLQPAPALTPEAAPPPPKPRRRPTIPLSPRLQPVALSPYQWTGVTVARGGRIFVNFPRWSDYIPMSVAQVLRDGTIVPYPNPEWNTYTPANDPAQRFVCVQSVYVDDEDFLWVLDTGNPRFEGTLLGAPKLVRIDLQSDTIVQTIAFNRNIARAQSYLNDLRVDTLRHTAYITDSGEGALIVVDLQSGEARRLLDGHASTTGDGIEIVIEGRPWRQNGVTPNIHADGIALSPDRQWLYYMPLSESRLYRIATQHLRNPKLSLAQLAAQVQTVAEPGPCDGIAFGPDGRLYLTTLETPSLDVYDPESGRVTQAVKDPRLAWPDTLAPDPSGKGIFVTTSQIHRGPNPREPYRLMRLVLAE